jgi:hypothetical protein
LDRAGTDFVEMLCGTRAEIITIKLREPFALTRTGPRRFLTQLGAQIQTWFTS